MNLKILLPAQVLYEGEVTKITAEAENGFFTLLPRHIDFAAALVPGLLYMVKIDGGEEFLAVEEGILVKRGSEVLVSVSNALRGPDLGKLREVVIAQFKEVDDHERQVRSAAARLEAEFIQRFIELGEDRYG